MEILPEGLQRWIVRMMADLTEEGFPDRFELFHTVDGGAERLEKFKCKQGDEASELAQLLYDAARHDADTRDSKHQRYTICLFRSENQTEPETQYPFRIQPRPGTSWSGGDTEQPTEKGERAQLMRVQNDTHSIMMRMAESFGGRMVAEVNRVTERCDKLEEARRKDALQLEDLKDRQLDREIDRAARLQKEKMLSDIAGSLIPLLPVIASGLTSKLLEGKGKDKNGHESKAAKSLIPANAEMSSRHTILREMFANMSDEEKQGMVEALRPMHRMVFFTLFKQFASSASDIEIVAFDTGMQKFLKGLAGDEVMGILNVLDQGNRNRFMVVYQSYGKSEEASQEDSPDILKDNPAASAGQAPAESS